LSTDQEVADMPNDQDITLNIATPAGAFSETFDKNTKVEAIINLVIERMGLAPGEQFELYHEGQALKPVERPLVSFQLEDGDQVELVATGSGV
jgi:hypothetical protein